MRTNPTDREVVEELASGLDDWLLTKWYCSASLYSDLLQRTRAANHDQSVLYDVHVHAGVLIFMVDTHSNDIQPLPVADAITSLSGTHYHVVLEYVTSRCVMVVTIDEVLE